MAAWVICPTVLSMLIVVLGLCRLTTNWSAGQPAFKCARCRHCRRVDPDGVMCRFGNRETFMTPVHIKYCTDFEDDPRIAARR